VRRARRVRVVVLRLRMVRRAAADRAERTVSRQDVAGRALDRMEARVRIALARQLLARERERE